MRSRTTAGILAATALALSGCATYMHPYPATVGASGYYVEPAPPVARSYPYSYEVHRPYYYTYGYRSWPSYRTPLPYYETPPSLLREARERAHRRDDERRDYDYDRDRDRRAREHGHPRAGDVPPSRRAAPTASPPRASAEPRERASRGHPRAGVTPPSQRVAPPSQRATAPAAPPAAPRAGPSHPRAGGSRSRPAANPKGPASGVRLQER